MSEVVSFGNIINALHTVRDDYNNHLKSVPQYEAFLLVESSTQKAVESLHAIAGSSSPSVAEEVINSLKIANTKFREHLTSVPEYRALLAIDKLIVDVSTDLGVQAIPGVAAAEAKLTPNHPVEVSQPDAEQASAPADAVAESEVAEQASVPAEAVAASEVAEQASAPSDAVARDEFAEQVSEPLEAVAQSDAAEQAATPSDAVAQAEVAEQVSTDAVVHHEVAEQALAAPEAVAQHEVAEQTSVHPEEAAVAAATEDLHEPLAVPFGEGTEKAA
jgi:hypothetical protein